MQSCRAVSLKGCFASLQVCVQVFPAQLNLQARPLVKTVASILLTIHVELVPPTKAKRAIYWDERKNGFKYNASLPVDVTQLEHRC
jgi:hypothetical protein